MTQGLCFSVNDFVVSFGAIEASQSGASKSFAVEIAYMPSVEIDACKPFLIDFVNGMVALFFDRIRSVC